jgi:hypothetical protein
MARLVLPMVLVAGGLVALAVGGRSALPQEKVPRTKVRHVKKVAVGRNVFVEVEERKAVRVLVQAYVCLREGMLEHLLTRRFGKEHEAILAADIDARHLHTGLLLTGAEPGRPIILKQPQVPPSGTPIKITLVYKTREGMEVRVPAQKWIRHAKKKQDLQTNWVFVGSGFEVDESDPGKVHYLANGGDVICVANFEAALLDLPILSPAEGENDYEAHTEHIPRVDTPVLVILEPVRAKSHEK